MSDPNFEDDFDEDEDQPQETPKERNKMRDLREAAKRGKQADELASQLKAANAKLALIAAGYPVDDKGQFANAVNKAMSVFDGDPTAETVKAHLADFGLNPQGVTSNQDNQATERANDAAQSAAMSAELAGGVANPPGATRLDPQAAGVNVMKKLRGENVSSVKALEHGITEQIRVLESQLQG